MKFFQLQGRVRVEHLLGQLVRIGIGVHDPFDPGIDHTTQG